MHHRRPRRPAHAPAPVAPRANGLDADPHGDGQRASAIRSGAPRRQGRRRGEQQPPGDQTEGWRVLGRAGRWERGLAWLIQRAASQRWNPKSQIAIKPGLFRQDRSCALCASAACAPSLPRARQPQARLLARPSCSSSPISPPFPLLASSLPSTPPAPNTKALARHSTSVLSLLPFLPCPPRLTSFFPAMSKFNCSSNMPSCVTAIALYPSTSTILSDSSRNVPSRKPSPPPSPPSLPLDGGTSAWATILGASVPLYLPSFFSLLANLIFQLDDPICDLWVHTCLSFSLRPCPHLLFRYLNAFGVYQGPLPFPSFHPPSAQCFPTDFYTRDFLSHESPSNIRSASLLPPPFRPHRV